MSITAPINRPSASCKAIEETATGPGSVQGGFSEAGFWNVGGAPVIINGQSIPVNGKRNFDVIVGKQYVDNVIYDATGSTLLITAVY